MLEVKTTGVEQYLDGSANIKLLIIGGPGAGKTRYSSFWPRPFYLDCEDGLGSVVDRQVPYVRIRSSKDMLDGLEYLKTLERTPKAERKFQTVIVDTVDSFQRIVKEEWLADTKSGVFTGYDAWGYLDTKMSLLMTRLLNLDYNVVVLVHYKEKDSDGTKEYGLQLQGNVAQTIFNDFALVGWLGTYWEAGETGREQKRGLTFQPTPDKDFLKDRFNATPKWLPVTLTSEEDYDQLWRAFFDRPEFDAFAESQVVDQIPDAEAKVVDGPVASPAQNPGGPVAPRPPVEVPLDKKLKGELQEIARGLGLDLPDNTLKGELIKAIEDRRAAVAAQPAPAEPAVPAATEGVPGGEAGASTPSEVGTAVDPTPSASSPSVETTPVDAADASPANASADATSGIAASTSGPPVGVTLSPEQVAESLGATVITEEKNDTPVTPQAATPPPTPAAKPPAPQGPSVCADCGDDLTGEWADPSKRDYVRLGFVKHRRYLDEKCRNKANGQ